MRPSPPSATGPGRRTSSPARRYHSSESPLDATAPWPSPSPAAGGGGCCSGCGGGCDGWAGYLTEKRLLPRFTSSADGPAWPA